MYAVTCSTDLMTSHLHINFSITFLVIIHLYKLIHAMWSAYFIDRVKKALYNINRIVYRSWWFFLNNVPIMYHHLTVWCHQRSSWTPNIKGQWGWSTQSWSWKHGGTVLHTVNSDLFCKGWKFPRPRFHLVRKFQTNYPCYRSSVELNWLVTL